MIDYIHNLRNIAPIDELYAFMSEDENGYHCILSTILPGLGTTPMVVGSKRAAEGLKPHAIDIARKTGLKVAMFVFHRGDAVWKAP